MLNNTNNLLASFGLSFRAERVSSRPDGLMGSHPGQRHWRVEFRTLATDFALVTHFTQGSAHTEDPTGPEVLECLALDARSVVDCSDVLDFAAEGCWDLDFSNEFGCADELNHLRAVFAGCNETLDALDRLVGEDGRERLLALDCEAFEA